MMREAEFSALKGVTLAKVDATDEQIVFHTGDGQRYVMQHDQNCCEQVTVEDITGDWEDVIGSPIEMAEESSEEGDGMGMAEDSSYGSHTWTFYKLRTNKGSVTIRWYGSSNGYYSEGVSFYKSGTEH